MRFNHLNVPNQWRHYWTKYPEGYSLLEALLNWVNQVNEMVDAYNDLDASTQERLSDFADRLEKNIKDTKEFLDKIENYTMRGNLEEVLTEWEGNGRLSTLINQQVLNDIKQEQEQTDFVEVLRQYNEYPHMQFQKINNGNGFEVTMYNDQNKQVTMQFLFNGEVDEYLIHTRTWEGGYSTEEKAYNVYLDPTTTDFQTEPSDSTVGYTTTIGATVQQQVTIEKQGDSVYTDLHVDDRGGLWEFELNGQTTAVSTWAPSTGKDSFQLFDDLSPGTYTLTGTFQGDDPNNAPSDGTARGWLNSKNYDIFSVRREFAVPVKTDETLIKPPSNLEFAYRVKPTLEDQYEFVPFHGVQTAYEKRPMVIYDGDEVVPFDDMPNLSYREVVQDIQVEQQVYGKHPASTANLIEITTYQTITKDGHMRVDGRMKVLQDTYFTNSYVIMGVATAHKFNEIITSFGNTFPNTSDQWLAGDNTTDLEDEGDRASSYAFLSSTNKNIGIAFRFNHIWETLRQSASNKDPYSGRTYIQHRDEDLVKIYSRLWDGEDNLVPAGYVHRFSGDYVFSNKRNVYDILSMN